MQESSTSDSGGEHDDELRSPGPADGETQSATDANASRASSEVPELEEQQEPAASAAPTELTPDQLLADDALADDALADDALADDDAAHQNQSRSEPSAEGDGEHRSERLSERTSDSEIPGPIEPALAPFEPEANAPLPEPEMAETLPELADGTFSDETPWDEGEAGVPTESVAEPIAEHMYEPVAEPIAEHMYEPIAGPPAGPSTEPSTLVAHTPWTLRQTIVGTVLTLGPWLIFALGTQLAARGSPAPTPAHRLAPSVDLAQAIVLFIVSSVLEAIFLIAPLYYAIHTLPPSIPRRARWPTALRSLGLRLPNPAPAVRAAVAAIVVILGASVAYTSIVNTLHLPLKTNVDTLMQQAKYEPYTVVGTLLVAVLVAPFCEEMFFRGYLFPGLARGMQLWVAVLASAALFGLAHADLGSFVVLFVIGIVLAVVRARTDSLWPGIAVHTLNNTIAFISILVLLR